MAVQLLLQDKQLANTAVLTVGAQSALVLGRQAVNLYPPEGLFKAPSLSTVRAKAPVAVNWHGCERSGSPRVNSSRARRSFVVDWAKARGPRRRVGLTSAVLRALLRTCRKGLGSALGACITELRSENREPSKLLRRQVQLGSAETVLRIDAR